eukprot:m.134082 g.134082  ORF g.134082 m.134082 type:complete len:723 (+) comp29719_c0_seq2:209-2377(+)
MAAQHFPKLFQPLQVGGTTLINRAIMGSMHTGLEEGDGWGSNLTKMAGFFKERAEGSVGLMVTGGIAPNVAGRVSPFAAMMTTPRDAQRHREVTEAVHSVGSGSKIAMQILHSGRYGYHPFQVSASKKRSPISWFTPKALSGAEVESTIGDFVRAASLAEEAGYDGVEVMGSEGYLINQFLANRTNMRTDDWGGSFENRCRFPLEIVRQIRAAVGKDFLIIFRLSMLDLVQNGSDWTEVVALAQGLEDAGVSIINTGIGWHEARIPTIATSVPRAGFAWVPEKLQGLVSVPLVATNRINTPEIAEDVLSKGQADLVSMARPFLADPQFLTKAARGESDHINTCIACNQACLDHSFAAKRASCMVNPRAGYETELHYTKTTTPLNLAVVGAGPAGLAFATVAAGRGHNVTIYEGSATIGGQFNLAKQVPGKEEFHETIRYFKAELKRLNIAVHLNHHVNAQELIESGVDKVVLASGVTPRKINIEGSDHPSVVSYADVLSRKVSVGKSVAVIGAGGIGFDVAEFLVQAEDANPFASEAPNSWPGTSEFLAEWGIDALNEQRGGLQTDPEHIDHGSDREIFLLQRKEGKLGAGLGKTTGWIHRTNLKKANVNMINSVSYEKIDDEGLHVVRKGKKSVLAVDTIVVCAGQLSVTDLEEPLKSAGLVTCKIGGAFLAAEIDAKRAIDQASRLAADIEQADGEKMDEYYAPLGVSAWLFENISAKLG